MGRFLETAFARHPARLAFVDVTRYRRYPVGYAVFGDRVRRLRSLFKDWGVRQGDRVVLWGRNSSYWAGALAACFQSGFVAVPLDLRTPEEMFDRILEQTEPRLLLADRPVERPPRTALFEDLPALLSETAPLREPVADVSRSDLAEIVYTSGTTGLPKGVMLTHGNLLADLEGFLGSVFLPMPLRLVSTLPLSHMLEQTVTLFFALANGCAVVYADSLRPVRLSRIVRESRAHGMVAVPGTLQALRAYCERNGLSPRRALGWRFRVIGSGGASLPVELERWWRRRGVLIVQGYGMTETSPLISVNSLFRARLGSIGRPLPNIDVKLAADGELLVKGAVVTPGYYRRPETARELYNEEGWLGTGDVVERRGRDLFFKGRKKEMIKTTSGLIVYPDDIERVLDAEEGVADSCVLEWQDKIWAVLRLQDSSSTEEIVRRANAKLASHQLIIGASAWPFGEFPKTPLGKIRRFEVRRRLEELLRGEKPRAQPAYASPLESIVARVLGGGPIRRESSLTSLGMDSLKRIELLSAIEEETGVVIEEMSVSAGTSFEQLSAMVAASQKAAVRPLPRWQFSVAARLGGALLRPAADRVVDFAARPRAEGLERLKSLEPPALFVANHESAYDGAIIRSMLPRRFRRLAIPALPDFFGLPPKTGLCEAAGWRLMGLGIGFLYQCYPFGPAAGMERGFEATGRLVDEGFSILIFPEGGRTPDGRLQPFFSGVGVLARELDVPVVPVRISGMHEIMPYPRFVFPKRRGKSVVVFGEPRRLPRGLVPEAAARAIEEAVSAL